MPLATLAFTIATIWIFLHGSATPGHFFVGLILAALKDRDIAARSKGNSDGVAEDEILDLLQKMVRQRKDSIEMYMKGGRQDLVDREKREIEVIERFLPKPLDEAEVQAAVEGLIAELGAEG